MRSALGILLVIVLASGALAAEAPDWSRKLGRPATAETIAAALEEAAETEDGERLLAKALGTARGPAAVQGLLSLLRNRDRDVRTEALGSLVRLDLRSDGASKAIYRRSLRASTRYPAEQRAAVLALGAVGDGSDMEALLTLASAEQKDTTVRDHAFRAMAALSGKKLPYVHSRWSYWWRKQKTGGLARLRKTLDAAEAASGTPALAAHRKSIQDLGWIDTAVTQRKLLSWLRGARIDLQIAACDAAAELRLGDLAEEVQKHARGRGKQLLRAAAKRALERLGAAAGGPSR